MTKKIAIIGTGISGLTCGHLLHGENDITVFEENDYIGGHTATKTIEDGGETHRIDTGFIVFNDWTYPNFIALMKKLGVAYQPTEQPPRSGSTHRRRPGGEQGQDELHRLRRQKPHR